MPQENDALDRLINRKAACRLVDPLELEEFATLNAIRVRFLSMGSALASLEARVRELEQVSKPVPPYLRPVWPEGDDRKIPPDAGLYILRDGNGGEVCRFRGQLLSCNMGYSYSRALR